MNGPVILLLALAVISVVLYVYLPVWLGGWRSWRWVTYWREANKRQDEQVRDALIPRDLGDMK